MTNKSKHTPGPWNFERTKTDIEYAKITGKELLPHEGYFRDNDGGWFVAGVAKVFYKGTDKKGYGKPDDEGQANARLIAAAPELLAALEFCADALNTEAGGLYKAHIEQARAAIAKARGQ